MTTYRRRQTDTIEATQFTSELGGIVRGVTAGTYPDGLEHSEHSGYSFHGQRICFGDYMVGSMLVEKAAFEKQWELAATAADYPLPTPPEVRAALEKLSGLTHGGRAHGVVDDDDPPTKNLVAETRGTTGSVAVDTALAAVACAGVAAAEMRGKR